MPAPVLVDPAFALFVETGTVLGARRLVLEFERKFALPARKDAAARELFEVRVAEARLKGLEADPAAHLDVLAPLANSAALELEQVAASVYPCLSREVDMGPAGCLQALTGLLRLARIDEARTRAVFTAARQGQRLPGFDDALELAEESEQIFLASRSFEELLSQGRAWGSQDVDWLLLRCTSVPGRLRLRALALRVRAHGSTGGAWDTAQAGVLELFGPLELEPETALAWSAAGFSPEEAVDWRSVGLKNPAQAHAWHCHGFGPKEALDWSRASLLPDESGVYVHCGAETLEAAVELRRSLVDVQHFFAWYRAGFRAPEVLDRLREGVRTPEEALKRRAHEALNRAVADAQRALSSASPGGPIPAPGGSAGAPGPGLAPPVGAASAARAAAPPASGAPGIVRGVVKAEAESWAQQRARERLGAGALDEAAARTAAPPDGGAWMAWGCMDAQASAQQAGGTGSGFSLPMAGGLFDLVMSTEGVALPGLSFEPKTFEPEPEWQQHLDRLRQLRGAPSQAGAWYLAAWPPLAACLQWGLLFHQSQPPWADAVDYLEGEPWKKRWARKTEEWGEEGLASVCEVHQLPGGLWTVALSASRIVHTAAQAVRFEAAWPSAAWREQLEDFCLKMEIPRQPAHWHLLAMKGGTA